MTDLLKGLLAWVSANPEWAHLTVFLIALTESLAVVGMVVPGVIMMLGAGALVATGALGFWPVCLWAIAGAVAGDGLSYWAGRRFRDRLRRVWPFSRYPETLERGERFFERYGGKSVAFGRFVGPVRAIIPLVAGMMGMTPARFLIANVLSAIAWAPVYLLPGIVFGASLELAAEAAVRLVILALSLVLGIWLLTWAVHRLFLFYSPRAGRWVEAMLRWAEVHPRMGEIARALADPDHPDARALAALAGTLLLATLLFALLAGMTLAEPPDLAVNRVVLDMALSLHSPAADHLMAAASRLADWAVILPLGLAVYGWLLARGQSRQANYWIAAMAFGLLAAPVLKWLLQVPRPDIGLVGLSPWAFPSSHTLRATVVFGFLAVSVAGSIAVPWRWIPYALAALLVAAVGISRIYLGAHWLTDVLGSLTLGLAWVAALGLAYRRHTAPGRSGVGLAALAGSVLAVAFGVTSLASHQSDLVLYQPVREAIPMAASQWRQSGWQQVSRQREDPRAVNEHPLSLQYAGDPQALAAVLAGEGWRRAATLGPDNAMRLLSPSLPLKELPVVPHVHDGHHEDLALVRQDGADRRLVLRLWSTPFRIDGRVPLWVGNVTAQHKRVILGMLALPSTDPETEGPLRNAAEGFDTLAPFQPGPHAPLLLTSP
jgi:membrane protein DedA with SNARE-associated domain/membrane-associated phospholipid phosphatase